MSVAMRVNVEPTPELVILGVDWIHVENLLFYGKHGVGAAERAVDQPFSVSVKLSVDTRAAARSDVIEDTTDYGAIKNIIQQAVQNESYHLVEKLAERIASDILRDKRIRSVELSIKKMAVWDNGIPGVTIVRKNI